MGVRRSEIGGTERRLAAGLGRAEIADGRSEMGGAGSRCVSASVRRWVGETSM